MRYARGLARAEVPARTAIVGNPSDVFGGATIALALDELSAVVQAEPGLDVVLRAGEEELGFEDIGALAAAAERGEYPDGGALALLMAAAHRFTGRVPESAERGLKLQLARSTIPPGVGLAGSSAIVIAALRALGALFGHEPALEGLPQLALACETEELGITAGLQDRVIQTHGGLMFMDFDPTLPGGGRYQALDPRSLPPLFVAWLTGEESNSGAAHGDVAARFQAGDPEVVAAVRQIAALAEQALRPILTRDAAGLGVLMEENFELRRRIYELDPRHVELIEAARELGAPANYTGSGGAVVGLFRDEDHLAELRAAFTALGCELLVRRRA